MPLIRPRERQTPRGETSLGRYLQWKKTPEERSPRKDPPGERSPRRETLQRREILQERSFRRDPSGERSFHKESNTQKHTSTHYHTTHTPIQTHTHQYVLGGIKSLLDLLAQVALRQLEVLSDIPVGAHQTQVVISDVQQLGQQDITSSATSTICAWLE